MDGEHQDPAIACPGDSGDSATTERDARRAFDEVLRFCSTNDGPFRSFERDLLQRLFALGCLLVRLFLTRRRSRLSSAGSGIGSDPRRLFAVGDSVRDEAGNADEFCVEPVAVPFGVGVVAVGGVDEQYRKRLIACEVVQIRCREPLWKSAAP